MRGLSEGGAIETDGHRTLMATRSSIINHNRNPGKTEAQLTAAMRPAYGASRVIWLRDQGQGHPRRPRRRTSRFIARGRALVQYPAQASDHNIWSEDERRQ